MVTCALVTGADGDTPALYECSLLVSFSLSGACLFYFILVFCADSLRLGLGWLLLFEPAEVRGSCCLPQSHPCKGLERKEAGYCCDQCSSKLFKARGNNK